MAEGYQYLDSLRTMLRAERVVWMEKIARSSPGTVDTEQRIGRCKALEWAIEKVNEQIKSINGGDDDAASPTGK